MYPKLRDANVLVLATPVYVPLPAEMQNFINRVVPLMNPITRREDGPTRAQFPDVGKIGKIALVSTCGWWENGNFDTIMRIVRELANDMNVEFAGALLRPHSSMLVKGEEKTERVLKGAERAGYRLVMEGKMPRDLVRIVGSLRITYEAFSQESG